MYISFLIHTPFGTTSRNWEDVVWVEEKNKNLSSKKKRGIKQASEKKPVLIIPVIVIQLPRVTVPLLVVSIPIHVHSKMHNSSLPTTI